MVGTLILTGLCYVALSTFGQLSFLQDGLTTGFKARGAYQGSADNGADSSDIVSLYIGGAFNSDSDDQGEPAWAISTDNEIQRGTLVRTSDPNYYVMNQDAQVFGFLRVTKLSDVEDISIFISSASNPEESIRYDRFSLVPVTVEPLPQTVS